VSTDSLPRMGLKIEMFTIDCENPRRLAEFWTKALGLRVLGDYGVFVFLGDESGAGPKLGLQQVPEPRQNKNRAHIDLAGADPKAEVERLIELGARKLGEHSAPGMAWTVLADPEGNEFCVGAPDVH
jgi:catechol 2,3-dioxygenase-like lactoylglutathione lyase family enzyme